jgi:hypothetical protein
MWTKTASPKVQEAELGQLGFNAAIGRYSATALRGLATGLIIGAIFIAFYHLGFLKGAIAAAVLIGARAYASKKFK